MLLGSGKKKEEERLGFKKLFYTFWLETVLTGCFLILFYFDFIFFQSSLVYKKGKRKEIK